MAMTIGQSSDVVEVVRFLATPTQDAQKQADVAARLRRLLDEAGKRLQISSTAILSDAHLAAALERVARS